MSIQHALLCPLLLGQKVTCDISVTNWKSAWLDIIVIWKKNNTDSDMPGLPWPIELSEIILHNPDNLGDLENKYRKTKGSTAEKAGLES